jgi:hypothetical protein
MHGKHWLPACTHKPRAGDAPVRKRVYLSATVCTYSLPWKNLTGVFAPRADPADAATIWFEAFDFDVELGAHTQMGDVKIRTNDAPESLHAKRSHLLTWTSVNHLGWG